MVLSLLVSAVAGGLAQGPVRSPEVHSDRTVTFRFKDVAAAKVELSLEGYDSRPMAKGADGVWSVTTPALPPDLYGYSFNADGETRLDPRNPLTKPNLIWPSNMVLVPGSPPKPWEVRDIPHGVVHRHAYRSKIVGDDRDFYVYTPPRYRAGARYPTLYLLHGFSDTADGWTAVGKAHLILDSLIAEGKAKPMVVVMPLGYGIPNFVNVDRAFRDQDFTKRSFENFGKALLTEVLPMVERTYSVSREKGRRAIAGLSMGGAESLYVGLKNLDKFSYVGAFSSGGLPAREPGDAFPNLDASKVNKELKLLWIACGTEDGLIGFARGFNTWLEEKGVKTTYLETPGRHAWMVWRRNLADFAGSIF